MRRTEGDSGFTLLELTVALAIFSLAAMALLNLAGQNARTAASLEARAFAQMVAETQAVEAAIAPFDALGAAGGQTEVAGRVLLWSRTATPTPDPAMVRVDITVRAEDSDQVIASTTLFRTAP